MVIARGVAIGVIAVAYVLTAWMVDMSIRARWAYVGGFFALLAATSTVWGWSFVYYGVYVTIVIAALIPWRIARLMIVGWGVLLLIIAAVIPAWTPAYIALIAVAMGLAMGSGLESGRVGAQLARAHRRVSTLAVSAERERISRDLHDILGHSLTAISIKSELAGRLVDANPDAAKAQIAEVEEIARQALADVRSTASAIREVRVAVEVAGARSVLLAAGIEAQVPAALPTLSDQTSELFGFVVREAVTNVVRHSGATRCTISVTEDRVEIVDNGSGLGPESGGSGLRGLAARVAAAGGELRVESVPGQGTRVVAVLGRAVADQAPDGRLGARRDDRTGRARGEGRAMITVVLVDDQTLIRQALAALLQLAPDIKVVGEAADGPTAVAAGRTDQAGRGLDGRAVVDLGGVVGRHHRHRRDPRRPPRDAGDHRDHLRPARLPAAGDGGRSRRVHGQGRAGRPAARCHPPGAPGSAGRRSGAGRGQPQPGHIAADRAGDRGPQLPPPGAAPRPPSRPRSSCPRGRCATISPRRWPSSAR